MRMLSQKCFVSGSPEADSIGCPTDERQPQRIAGCRGLEGMLRVGSAIGRVAILLCLILFYPVLGMFMAMLSMMVSTILLVIPIVSAVGVDPIWFGVFIGLMCELGLITPPVCVNLFGAQGIRPDKGLVSDVIQGAIPHAVIMILFAVALTAFPARHQAAGTDAGLTGACRQTALASVMRPVQGPAGRHLPAGRWRRGRP